jgi:hypothetical protein
MSDKVAVMWEEWGGHCYYQMPGPATIIKACRRKNCHQTPQEQPICTAKDKPMLKTQHIPDATNPADIFAPANLCKADFSYSSRVERSIHSQDISRAFISLFHPCQVEVQPEVRRPDRRRSTHLVGARVQTRQSVDHRNSLDWLLVLGPDRNHPQFGLVRIPGLAGCRIEVAPESDSGTEGCRWQLRGLGGCCPPIQYHRMVADLSCGDDEPTDS